MKGGVTGMMAGSAASAGVEAIRTAIRNYGDEAVRKTFARAMFDPDYAQALVRMSRERTAKGEAAKEFYSKVGYVAGKLSGGEM
jgi:hypothetical protein